MAGFAKRSGAWVCYDNLVGGQDELVFDGGSMVVDPQGELMALAKRFAEDLLVVDLEIDGELDKPGLRYASFWPKLDKLKIPYQFIKMPGAPHPFWHQREWFIPTVDATDAFLKKHLR